MSGSVKFPSLMAERRPAELGRATLRGGRVMIMMLIKVDDCSNYDNDNQRR